MTAALAVQIGDVGDLADVMRVMNTAFDPAHGEAWSAAQCAGALAIPGTQLIVARSGGEVAGFALARTVLDETELLLLAVSPNFSRRGVGRSIIEELVGGLRLRQVRKLFLEVRENNPARAFYEHLNFVQSGFRKNYYRGVSGIYINAVTLSLNL